MKRQFLFFAIMLTVYSALAQWEPDVRLTNSPDSSVTYYGMSHNIAANGDSVHITWYDHRDGNYEIYYTRSVDGGDSWGPQVRLTDDPARSSAPSLAVSAGVVHLVWLDPKSGNSEIYYKRSADGGTTWQEETRLSWDDFRSYGPTVAARGPYIHVAWSDEDVNNQTIEVHYNHSDDGGISWIEELWLSSGSSFAYNPTIALSGEDVHIAWNDTRDGNLEIYYIKSSDNGLTWGPEIRLTDDPAVSQLPSISAEGSFVHIAWNDYRDGNSVIYYKGSVDGGSEWGGDTRITYNPYPAWVVNMAVSNSVIHLVWNDYRNMGWDVFYNYSTDGGVTWATDTQLNDFSYFSQRPFIAVSGSVLHAIWYDYRDFDYEIYYKRNPTGGLPVGVPELEMQNCIYPNPAGRLLTVGQSAVIGPQSAVRLTVVDLFGREIKEWGNIASFPCQLDISDLRNGVYFLRLIYEDGKSGIVKFLKIDE